MSELTGKDIENFKEWSEGNEYLFELLCTCKKNNITTFASCGGHEIEELLDEERDAAYFPYIGFCIDDTLLNHIDNIVNELKYMNDIEMRTGYAGLANGASFVINASRGNCCEVFNRMNNAIVNRNKEKTATTSDTKNILKKAYANIKASQILKSARKISSYSLEECKKKIKGCDVSFDTRSKDLLNHFAHLQQVEWEGTRTLYPKYQRLYDKYSYPLQKELPKELQKTNNTSKK